MVEETLDFTNGIPEGFVLSKPIKQECYNEKTIYELEERGDMIITRKRDGYRVISLILDHEILLYTDGINKIDSRLDHIRKSLRSLNLPHGTIPVGELLIAGDNDSLGQIGSFMQSSLEEAMALQAEIGLVQYMIFGIITYGIKSYLSKPFSEVLAMINQLLEHNPPHLLAVPVLNVSFAQAKADLEVTKHEGIVIFSKTFCPELRLDGKSPTRPKDCYKWKIPKEDDFAIFYEDIIWNPDVPDRLKEVQLCQKDPTTGEWFKCFKLGVFTKQKRAELQNKAIYPMVMKINFKARWPKSGKLRDVAFECIRDDKRIEDCWSPVSYPEPDLRIKAPKVKKTKKSTTKKEESRS